MREDLPWLWRVVIGALLASLLGSGVVAEAPEGRITFPDDGEQCLGWAHIPVRVEDDFPPELPRTYLPAMPGPAPRQRLVTDPRPTFDQDFGDAIALQGDTMLVGARADDSVAEFGGAGFLFRREATGDWGLEAKLVADERVPFGTLGESVALDGNVAVLGASPPPLGRPGNRTYGALHIYERVGDREWNREAVFNGDDEIERSRVSVAVSGDTAVLGVFDLRFGPQAADVYRRIDGTWKREQKIAPADLGGGDRFGAAVALDGDTLVVGAHGAFRLHVFRRHGTSWTEEARIPGIARLLHFRGAVIVANGVGRGVVVLREVAGGWVEEAHLTRPGVATFGSAAAVDGDVLVVGAEKADNPLRAAAGGAFVYRRTAAGWIEDGMLFAYDTAACCEDFGRSVAVDAATGTIAVGRPQWTGGAAYVGAVTVFGPETDEQGYRLQGDYDVDLLVEAPGEERALDSVRFRIDLTPPRTRLSVRLMNRSVPFEARFDEYISTDPETIHERMLWDGCVVFDGDTYGNRDGLLEDEILVADRDALCEALVRCDLPGFFRSYVSVEARDCAGNVGIDGLESGFEVHRESCPD